jgi:glucokinase
MIVLTLDAGGTNFVFSALQDRSPVIESFALASFANDLERSLDAIVDGFSRARQACPEPPAAISFAFPAPADYSRGVIVSPFNLPAYRNVALGPMLEDVFGLPVFINNDGDLFALGEATAGFLPFVNGLLEKAGSPKRFHNLLGVTLGTGLGGGIVRDGRLFTGDNSVAGEMWLLRHRDARDWNAEEGASIRAVRRAYAELTGILFDESPEPKEICRRAEDEPAAREAFRRMGVVAGDAIAEALTLIDGLVVVGGGMCAAHRYWLPAAVAEMNSTYAPPTGERLPRLIPRVFNLEDPEQCAAFLAGDARELAIPRSDRRIRFDGLQRTGIGITRLGTSEAIAAGAYAVAAERLTSS